MVGQEGKRRQVHPAPPELIRLFAHPDIQAFDGYRQAGATCQVTFRVPNSIFCPRYFRTT